VRDFDYAAAADFLGLLFSETRQAVEIRALPNEYGAGPARPLFTRDPDLVQRHCEKWDDIGRAVYFGVATRASGTAKGDRAHVRELPALWSDIDCYKLGISTDAAVAALLSFSIPPSAVVLSGGGVHAYWLLSRPLDVSQTDPATWPAVELAAVGALKQLAGVFAGDLAVCDLARVMRLPGTHNTKDGTLRACSVLECSTWACVDFEELVEQLDIQGPLLTVPVEMRPAPVLDDDPWIAASLMLTTRPPVDIAARLAAMTYQGVEAAGIHETQLSVSSSLVAHGIDDEAIVVMIMEATMRASGHLGLNWNWDREERAVRGLISSARAKFAPELRPSARASAKVIELRGGGAKPRMDTEAQPEAKGDTLPIVRLGGGWLAANIDQAEECLIAVHPRLPIFQYGDIVARVAPGPIVVTINHHPSEVLGYRIIEMHTVAMRDELSRHIDFQKWDARAKKWVSTNCPAEIAEGLLARVGRWKLPVLRGIIAAPAIRPDNSLISVPGYDEATGLFFAPAGTQFPPLPVAPSREDALAALAMLKHPLRNMPFVDDASRSVALSAILTGIERPMMNFAPIHAFDAPQAGTGKGLICNYCAIIAIGHEAGAVLASDDPTETDKTLGAKIIAGHSIILLDNVTHILKSALLAQITSEPIVEPRILGKSAVVTVQNTMSILINGNNLVLAGDLPRRALKCRLDAKVDRPELRVFESENPIAVAKRDRGELVVAALTVLLAYRYAGAPKQKDGDGREIVSLGTFDQWDERVRHALIWLGEADPVATQENIRAVDRDIDNHQNLLVAWHNLYSDKETAMTAGRLVEIASKMGSSPDDAFGVSTREYPDLYEALIEIARAKQPDKIDTTRLGFYLRTHIDQVSAGFRIERAGKSGGNQVLWLVRKLNQS
jgi:hypothetical protein